MTLPRAEAVHLMLPLINRDRLPEFVEDCLAAGMKLIAISGEGAAAVEDEIDALIVGDGSNPGRFITTSAHASGEEATAVAMAWNNGRAALVVQI